MSTDALDRPGRRIARHLSALEAAAKVGVRHVICRGNTVDPEDGAVQIHGITRAS
ncbi:hypothetical protein ACSRUE_12880 [Sorangium sp. KYC3313]|uniref:hypothetical protein n=1 Tax=Sorangium sp. KYC3313 TaxID=3449740 RepID=UPI003F8B103A